MDQGIGGAIDFDGDGHRSGSRRKRNLKQRGSALSTLRTRPNQRIGAVRVPLASADGGEGEGKRNRRRRHVTPAVRGSDEVGCRYKCILCAQSREAKLVGPIWFPVHVSEDVGDLGARRKPSQTLSEGCG